MNSRLTRTRLLEGVRELTRRDPCLADISSRHGPPPLWQRDRGFPTLLHIILEQQVSLASARATFNRLNRAADPLTPESFQHLSDPQLRKIGFSRQKARYGRALARAVRDGSLDLEGLEHLDDEDARAELMKITGIGAWTADIYLLMALGRPDIWPRGDLALELAIQRIKGLGKRPTRDEALAISEPWRPWRAVAARLLWHAYLGERRLAAAAAKIGAD